MNEQNNQESLNELRHSAAHLLAAAIMQLYPEAKRTIGPSIETGFYYDFDNLKISEADFPKIEKVMHKLALTWVGFERHELDANAAKDEFKENEYKLELINEFSGEGQTLTIYQSGSFRDLCRGGHVEHPNKELKFFKLLSVAGAYWRGDEKNKMLTRIYGTAFASQEELDKYIWQVEEAKKRDHRKLGRELDLFVFSDLVGSGLPLYTPKGALVRKLLQDYVNGLQKNIGYQEVWTPQIAKADLFKTSGHYDKYQGDMFMVKSHYSEEEFFLKPMNCPNHCVMFGSQPRSYRDLPLRFSDFANLYRDEKPGELSGLTRLRAFSQDDGHCFCREDQIEQEFKNVVGIVQKALATFGMTYWLRLSLWDPNNKEKYLGDPSTWERAQTKLENMLIADKIEYKKAEGEAAIYGPKMDFIAVDALGREWQISTVQLDLIMAGRFGLVYTDSDGSQKTPVMIHRAILGSPERFMGLLIEHLAGAFPLWLAPVQVALLPISENELGYAQEIAQNLRAEGLRIEVDENNSTLGKKMVRAREQKVPYMAIIGKQEVENKTVTLKNRAGEQITLTQDEAIAKLKQEVASKL